MEDDKVKGHNSAILEITRKIYLTISIVAFVILSLFAVIVYHFYEPVASALDFIPEVSVRTFFLGLLGLYLSIKISRQVLRIIRDYSGRFDRILGITMDLREEMYGDILLEKIMDHALAI